MQGSISIEKDIPVGGIKIGYGNVGIIDKLIEKSIWENSGTVIFKGSAFLGIRTRIANNGQLVIGDKVRFNAGVDIVCQKKISFGDGCLVSWDTLFLDTDFHEIRNINKTIGTEERINPDKEIKVGKHVWIGCRSVVLKGSTIPDGSVIGAGSVIRGKLVGENSVFINNDRIKTDIEW